MSTSLSRNSCSRTDDQRNIVIIIIMRSTSSLIVKMFSNNENQYKLRCIITTSTYMYAIMHIRWITIKSQKKTLKTLCTFKITTKFVAFFLAFFIDKAALGVVELLYNANVTFSIFMIIIIMAHIFYSGEKDFFLYI
jgi:hypothetical protein